MLKIQNDTVGDGDDGIKAFSNYDHGKLVYGDESTVVNYAELEEDPNDGFHLMISTNLIEMFQNYPMNSLFALPSI